MGCDTPYYWSSRTAQVILDIAIERLGVQQTGAMASQNGHVIWTAIAAVKMNKPGKESMRAVSNSTSAVKYVTPYNLTHVRLIAGSGVLRHNSSDHI
jgi:hypothetical protein